MQQLLKVPPQTPPDDSDEEILEIFAEEVQEILEEILEAFNEWKNNPEKSEALKTLQRNFHTLKGSGRTVGAMAIGELGWRFENLLNGVIEGSIPRNEAIFTLVDKVSKILPNMVEQFQRYQSAPYEVILLISQAYALTESQGQSLGEFPEADRTVVSITTPETTFEITPTTTVTTLATNSETSAESIATAAVVALATHMANLAILLESYAKALLEQQAELPADDKIALFHRAIKVIEQLLAGGSVNEDDQQTLLDQGPRAEESPPIIPKPQPATAVEAPVPDEFLAIFLEEAKEILERTQSLVELWKDAPHNNIMPLLRKLQGELHTLKGGARMVGITAMGELTHSLESVLTQIVERGAQSNTKLQEVVQNGIDELAAMLDAVWSGVALEVPSDLIEPINWDVPDPNPPEPVPPNPVPVPVPPDIRIRVGMALIEKLTNLAGELSISRAHLEQQQGSVKNNLSEMEQTVVRLRDQLRRLEIETDAQILSHFHSIPATDKRPTSEEEFDPLELDRFSVMQQLSRSLMETINDLLNIQDFLKTLTRQSDTLLSQQNRMGTELQDAIMRTRMSPFSMVSLRLQSLVRKTAKELCKPVDLVISGKNVEFERTVLDQVVELMEHLLRNAIVHGVEKDATTRQQAGKLATAKITIDISKEGSELVLKVSDDGAGLNLPKIRQKAEQLKLIEPHAVINDDDLMRFILEQSFSTVKKEEINENAGRGVGMNVVNTNVEKLGGTLHIHSKMGQGTRFEIRLPQSLTIDQALLVHVGEETLAIPMTNVDAVMRAPRAEVLGDNHEVCYYKYMGQNYRVYQLGELLGFGKLTLDRPLIPTLLVRVADRRIALLVDNIEGSKEIVVKSVGKQIEAIHWIAGATILGDGRVILILDIPALTGIDKESHQVTSPVEVKEEEKKPVAKTIMVVDDSITVRKVTARLLKRQGLEIFTAKDGVDAIAQLQEQIPDLMLLDVEMPHMDGYELATQMRNSREWKHIPIIMITSRTGTKHRDRAEKIGINRYLGKPFNETELLENINALLNERAPPSEVGVRNSFR